MQQSKKHEEYWRRNLKMTAFLMSIWFFVTFISIYFARELNGFTFLGFPLGFYMGVQGSLIIYGGIVWVYARYMNRLDQEYAVAKEDE